MWYIAEYFKRPQISHNPPGTFFFFFFPFSSLLKYSSVNFFIGYFCLCVSTKLKQSGQYRGLVGNRYLWPSLLKKNQPMNHSLEYHSHYDISSQPYVFFSVASTEIPKPGHFNAFWGGFVCVFFFFLWDTTERAHLERKNVVSSVQAVIHPGLGSEGRAGSCILLQLDMITCKILL